MSDNPKHPLGPASAEATEETSLPTPGCRWQRKFLVKEPTSLPTGASAWSGLDIDQMEDLLLVSARNGGPEVDKAWEAVRAASPSNALLPLVSAKAEDLRIDVYKAATPPTLRDWRSLNPEVSESFEKAFVEAATSFLERLHEFGVGHFNLRPDTIFVDEGGPSPRFLFGGWETATLFRQQGLVPLPVDPFYAPPEAVGLTKHAGGETLRLWDWWSLGRVLQELLLGHSIVASVYPGGGRRSSDETRRLAEELLSGKAPGDLRSGAVEAMGEIGERRRLLLKGLLTTAKDGRWTEDECRLWLDGKYPKEHYLLSGKERCFRFEGEFYTIAEAARALNRDEKWKQAWQQLMIPDQPGTLAAFVREHAPEALASQCDYLRSLASDVEFADFPKAAMEEAILALLLQILAGGDFLWRGRHVDMDVLADHLSRENGEGLWLGAVWVLTRAKLTSIVSAFDTEAARILSDLGKLAAKATNKAHSHGWILQNNLGDFAKIWKIACSSPASWNQAKEALQKEYACSRAPAVQRIFKDERPSEADSVLLAFMAANPTAFGFVTHEEWARAECERLFDEGMHTARALFWRRLRRTFLLSPIWFGRLSRLCATWLCVALLLSLAHPGPLPTALALLPCLFALGVRFVAARHISALLRKWTPATAPWRWLDSAPRCRLEEEKLDQSQKSDRELLAALRLASGRISELSERYPQALRLRRPPYFVPLRLAALASWVLLALILLGAFRDLRSHPPSLEGLRTAWFGAKQDDREAQAREIRIAWPFKTPEEVRAIASVETRAANEAEKRQALARGGAYARQYIPSTLASPLLVRIDSENRFAFMIYDGAKGALADGEVHVLVYNPLPRTWLEIDGVRVFVPGD